jgi:hypothetical protein
VRPNNSPNTILNVRATVCLVQPCNLSTNQVFTRFRLLPKVNNETFAVRLKGRKIRSLTLRSNQRFRAEVKLVPEPSLSILALGVVGTAALWTRKQRRAS